MSIYKRPKKSLKLNSYLLPVVVVILLILQIFDPFKGWAMLLSGFGGMWLLSYIWARSLMKGLKIDREVPYGWVQVGDFLKERITLENEAWAPSLWVQVNDHSDMQGYEISSVTDVRGWQNRHWYNQGVANRRGLYTIGAVTLEAEDPFGLYKIIVDYSDTVNMIVVPPVISLPEMDIAPGGRIGDGKSASKGIKQTISTAGVREYVPGDSLRWLHWPTTARRGKPYVHLFDNEPSSDWWVLLDLDPEVQVGEGENTTDEHGVILAASLVNQGMQSGKHVGMIAQGDHLVWQKPDMGDSHLWSVLKALATVHPGGPPLGHILHRIRTSLGQRTSLIIITPNVSPDWLDSLAQLKRSGIVPTVILLDPSSFGGEGSMGNIRRRLMKMRVTHYTISADLLDRPKNDLKDEFIDWLLRKGRGSLNLDVWRLRWMNFSKALRTWGLYLLFFLGMVNALSAAVRGLESDFLWYLVGGGLVVGWLLTKAPISSWLYALLNGVAGVFIASLRVGRLGNTLFGLVPRLSIYLYQASQWIFKSADQPDLRPLQIHFAEIEKGFSALGLRLWDWGQSFVQGQPYFDPVVSAFTWGLSTWIVVVWAVWAIRKRDNPLLGFIPALGMVVSTLSVVNYSTYDVVLMLGATLASIILIRYDARERLWEASKLTYTTIIRSNVFMAAVALSLVLMTFSVLTPSISIEDIIDRLKGTNEPTGISIASSLGLEARGGAGDQDILEVRKSGGLPNRQLIGSGPELSEEVVMKIIIESLAGDGALEEDIRSRGPLYFRSLTYDRYTGTGWISRDTEIVEYQPGEQIFPTDVPSERILRQQVEFVEDIGGILHTAGPPISTDQSFRVSWRLNDSISGIYDLFGGTVDQDSYRADSLLQYYGVEELQSAGQIYPDWVRSRYISLPGSVPESVLTLARDLTAVERTPYDRAVAIERYLREIPYSLSVSVGPAGRDITDYFLFELKKGYCDYYATAMVVMARAAGIPARFVMGYIGQTYDEAEGAYIITADQAHSWVEIYFPGYGWVPFEPTGGRPAIERPPDAFLELPETPEIDLSPLVPNADLSQVKWFRLFGLSLLSIVVILLFVIGVFDLWLSNLPAQTMLSVIFKRLYTYARWMGITTKPGNTAYEFSRELTRYLERMGRGSYAETWALHGVTLLRVLTETYIEINFKPLDEIAANTKQVAQIYRQLRLRLWFLWLLGIVYKYPLIRPIFWEDIPLSRTLSIEDEL